MTKKSRTILFFTCVFLFLTISPLAILYSQGYRLDWPNKRLVKTGALFFKTSPHSAKIYINDLLKKKSDPLFGNALIENLIPQQYNVRIEKQGFQTWQKRLKVEKSMVTEAKNITLVPKDLNLDLLAKRVENLWFSNDQRSLITQERNKDQVSWSLKLYDLNTKVKSHLLARQELEKEKELEIKKLSWFNDSKTVLLKTNDGQTDQYFLLDLTTMPIGIQEVEKPKGVDQLLPHPESNKRLLTLSKTKQGYSLSEIDLQTKTSKQIIDNLIAFAVQNQNIYWLDLKGMIKKTNLGGEQQTLTFFPHTLQARSSYKLFVNSSRVLLREDDKLFVLDSSLGILREVSDNISDFKLSPDKTRVCFWNNYEIGVMFLEEDRDQPTKQKWEKVFLTRLSEKITNVTWWNNRYLLLTAKQGISVLEIDERDRAQIWPLKQIEQPKIFFNLNNKNLYLVSKNNVFISNSLAF
jgi:hypothetical protein